MSQIPTKLDFAALKEKALGSLYFFAKGILGYDRLNFRIHKPLCEELQDSSTNRKLVELPRGWYKTTVASIALPIWFSIRNPNEERILVVQNTHANACKKLSVIGQQWETNPLLRALFPELLPTRSSRWSADAKCLNRTKSYPEATYEAAGANTAVVSRHYTKIIQDDTVAPEFDELGNESLAPTHDQVQKAIGWHKLCLPLLDDINNDTIIIVGTRWYDQDLIRYVKDNEPQYKVTSRAAREDEAGKPDPKGQVTFPERFNEETLKEIETALGPYMYSCLYMNTPVRADDMLFKPEWFGYYERVPKPDHCMVYTTVDVATDPKLAKSADVDYNVVLTCAKDMKTGIIYVLDYFHKRCNPGDMAAAIFDHVVRYRPIVVGYENVAYQRSIDYWLKELMRQQNVYFCLSPIPRHGRDAKDAAIQALQPMFAAGAILIRDHMKALVSELLKYPIGDHDDIADALSMQLQLWKSTKIYRDQRAIDKSGDMTLDNAMEEIASRRSKGLVSLVFDPMRTISNLEIPWPTRN